VKIAIASSGLGHVARGIETWACDTAVALSQLSSCQVVKLLPADAGTVVSCSVARPEPGRRDKLLSERPKDSPSSSTQKPNNSTTNPRASGATQQLNNPTTDLNVTLFSGAPLPQSVKCHVEALPCLKRGDWITQQLSHWAPKWTWRWGWTSAYDLEQKSFWRLLWPILRDEEFDILHVQDPLLADLCRRYREKGKLRTKEILAHGTEETPEYLAKFPYVQHLAPWHLEQTLKQLEEKDCTTNLGN